MLVALPGPRTPHGGDQRSSISGGLLREGPLGSGAVLEPGLEHIEEFNVEGELLTTVRGTLPRPVLSTPRMISVMEYASVNAISEHLEPGTATVGFEVCIKHVGGALEGALCTVTAQLREVIEERKLRFDVEVKEGERTIGVGTHERRVIPVTR
jgi:fluoroacetyl-CoA thioesterase